jgi:hypothetical protein
MGLEMEEFEDFPVTPRSDEDLERCADELRSKLGFAPDDCPALSMILERAKARALSA